ncbi:MULTISPECIES: hypothetical protein [unclassified Polaribacter]|uniref:hypothetical protein n=1 Tax=unclassified Polaribacter TaxID=196858 RepID=UPI0011BF01BD|nr:MULTISPECIES: hypothetical protein [unclassified Polaribacter]TXD51489.1 hypothetical protein ES043_11890 [Polaribacter sp. IC063]TXD61783.1 hypothetical protein ES044_03430 [Polaribacter sp. IC066]
MKIIQNKTALIIIIGTIFFLFLTSCKNEVTELSSIEKETAKKEISARINEIVEGAKQLNIEMAMNPYLDSKDFLIINADGSSLDYSGMKEMNSESFKQMNVLKFTTINEKFRFLTKNKVLLTWFGKNELELKSGEKMKIESYTGTMLFEKINNEWSIVYAHESASQPQLEE